MFIKKYQKPHKYFAFFARISDLAYRKSEQTKKSDFDLVLESFLTIWYYSVALSVFIFVRLKSITTSIFRRFFIWQAIVRRPSVSTEGLFVFRQFSLHLQPV
jgi:hypothetical protein